MGPQFVAGPGALTTQAEGLASGLGSFEPFLNKAQGLTGPTAYQAYMSPYQQDVIDATMADFDQQAAKGLPALSAQAIGAGAFGGGREGVQRAEYQSASDRNRASLLAQLRQQGFGQAQNLAQADFGRNLTLAQQSPALLGQQISALTGLGAQQGARAQQGLTAQQQLLSRQALQPLEAAQQSPALLGQQIASLTGLGAQQAARTQQDLTAQQQLLSRQALQPLEAAQQFGSGVTQLIAGYPGRENILPPAATPSPLATGLGTASTLAGIYRLINPKPLFS